MFLRWLVLATLFTLFACSKAPQDSDKQEDQVEKGEAGDAAAQQSDAAESSESERLTVWLNEKYEQELQFSPIMMTFLGRKDKYDEIDDLSEDAELRKLAWKKASVEELKANFDYNKLDVDSKTSFDMWVYQYELSEAAAGFMGQEYVFDQMNGAQAFLPQFLMNFHKVDDLSDMEAYIKRISAIGRGLDQLLTRAKRYAKAGVRPPKFAYEGVLEQATNIVMGKPFSQAEKDSPLWGDVNSKIDTLLENGGVTAEQGEQLRSQAKAAILGDFKSAYDALITWFNADIVNADEIATGVGAREKGKAFYDHKLYESTTTSLNAEQIHELGLKEVARITEEMEAIKSKVGFDGSLQDFFTFIKTDERFFYPNTDEGRQGYITDTEEFLAYIDKRLPDFFGILPKAGLVVKRVEAFRERDGAAQHYYPGTPDGSRPGIYYAHLSDMKSMPKNEMEAIAYHEANPGHHMQISIAQELTSVPEFRKQARFTSYVEGWALYSELLAKEMGAYQDDYNDFGRLITEIWRAVRLVVDTGLHAKGWTEAEAVAYFKEKAPVAEGAVISEVQRYIVMPGQATAYKIGMIKIQELRASAEKTLGDKFDIRGFHDTVLGGGALPLHLLERRVDHWVKSVAE